MEVERDHDCPVCMESMMVRDFLEPECGHLVHVECMLRWLQMSTTVTVGCPMCRGSLDRFRVYSSYRGTASPCTEMTRVQMIRWAGWNNKETDAIWELCLRAEKTVRDKSDIVMNICRNKGTARQNLVTERENLKAALGGICAEIKTVDQKLILLLENSVVFGMDLRLLTPGSMSELLEYEIALVWEHMEWLGLLVWKSWRILESVLSWSTHGNMAEEAINNIQHHLKEAKHMLLKRTIVMANHRLCPVLDDFETLYDGQELNIRMDCCPQARKGNQSMWDNKSSLYQCLKCCHGDPHAVNYIKNIIQRCEVVNAEATKNLQENLHQSMESKWTIPNEETLRSRESTRNAISKQLTEYRHNAIPQLNMIEWLLGKFRFDDHDRLVLELTRLREEFQSNIRDMADINTDN